MSAGLTKSEKLGAQIKQWIRRLLLKRDSYRPERHYMRGPGPRSVKKTPESGK